jgi:O-antigen ligase
MTSLAYAALWIYVFSVPWGGVIVISSGVNVIGRLTGMAAVGLTLLAVLISGRLRRWHGFHVAALLFVIWAGWTQLYFIQGGDRLSHKFWTYAQLLLVLWMVWELAASKRRQLGLLTAYVFGAYVAAAGTILLFRSQAGMRRFAAGGADPNGIAMTLALAVPMAWYLGMTYHRPLLRWICRAYLPVGVVAIGLTGSRGGMLAGIVALLVIPLTITRLSPARLATAIAALALSGGLAVAFIPDKIVQRLATTGTSVEDLSMGGRFGIWMAGVKAFARRPLVGYGTGGFQGAVRPWGIDQVAHNSYLSVLVEQGLIGLLFYLSMFLAVFLSVRRLPRPERQFALVLLATLVMTMLPLTWEDNKAVWFVLAALLGLARAQAASSEGAVGPPLAPSAPLARSPMARRRLEPAIAPPQER